MRRSPKSQKKFNETFILVFKIIHLVPTESAYNFLLTIDNLGAISHRLWDTATYWLKKIFLPFLIQRFDSKWLLFNLWKSFTNLETKVFQAADSEDLV